jgi:chromosome segregation ATPase
MSLLEILQTEVDTLQKEVNDLTSEITALQKDRATFQINITFLTDHSHETLQEFQQAHTQQKEDWAEYLREMKQALAKYQIELDRKQTVLSEKQEILEWEKLDHQVKTGGKALQDQANKINQLAQQLESELQTLKSLAGKFNPVYAQWLNAPANIMQFKATTVPTVIIQSEGFEVRDKKID